MKRTVVLLATLLLSFGLTNAANQVVVSHSGGDTAFTGQAGFFIVSIENDALLGGISLGWHIYSPDGATFTLDEHAGSTFAGATPNGSKPIAGVPGSRWMSGAATDGSCWDLGGSLVNDQLAPAQVLVGGAALGGGLAAGGSEAMLEIAVTSGGAGQGEYKTLCIDSMFYPPAGQFIFDPGGTPASNLPFCVTVTEQIDPCPTWDGGNPTAMVVNHCDAGQVTVSATDTGPGAGAVFYYLIGHDGAGTATVGENTGVVTYIPDPADVGNPVTIQVEATDAVHQQGGCAGDPWAITVTVTNNTPVIDCGQDPVFVGKGNLLVKPDITATDADGCDALVFSLVSENPPFELGPGNVSTDDTSPGGAHATYTIQTTDNDIGSHFICLEVSDGITADTCCFTAEVLSVEPFEVQIEKTHETLQGHFVDVALTINLGSEPFGGFDFLIAYDASALAFTEAALGDALVQCGWEYFTYRYSWNGNCGNACPSGLLRLVGMAETNNGPNHPDYDCIQALMEGDPFVIATMTFFVSNDRTLECMYVPIRFYWMDCGDNTMSSIGGDSLFVDRFIYTISGDHLEDYDYGFPGYVGAPDWCLEGDKVEPVRFIDFINGGIDIVCGDSIDARGDINVNGVVYEIADAVMFTNYFIIGLAAFDGHIEASIAASDVNADGIALSVADLVYLVRVIVGDANPYPKPQPGAFATLTQQGDIVHMDASLDVGAVLMVFEANGVVTPEVNVDMDMKYSQSGNELRVLIYDIGKRGIDAGGSTLLTVPGATLVDAEVASYDGFTVEHMIDVKPTKYALLQNTPNPFNPSTMIALNMPVESDWTIEVYNVAGQLVRDYSGHSQAGTVEVMWNGTDNHGKSVASGIYFYRARTDQFSETKKMLLMK